MNKFTALVLTTFCFALKGQCSSQWDSYIIGGGESAKGRWPWMLSLQRLRPGDTYSHTCGASLLTDTWILTAAHCVDGFSNVSDYRVLVGAFNQTANDQEDVIYLKTILAHPDFDYDELGNPYDIAVAELQRPVDLDNPYVGLAKLPRRTDEFAHNDNCWATGWGRIDPDTNELSPVLKELNAEVYTIEECRAIWEDFRPSWVDKIHDEHVCIAGPTEGSCNGDSGGPLNCDMTGHGDWVVAGITSWGTGSTCQGATSVYLGTVPWLEWIQERVPGLPGSKSNS